MTETVSCHTSRLDFEVSVALGVFEAVASTRALTCSILTREGEWDQLMEDRKSVV